MLTATIIPKFINQPKPGKKMWSLKLEDEAFFMFPAALSSQLKVGGTYKVDYEESDFNGQTYRTIRKVEQQAAPSPTGTSRKTDPIDSDNMHCCAILTAFIKAGKVELTEESLWKAEIAVRNAHRKALANQPPKPRDDMDDEIPDFAANNER